MSRISPDNLQNTDETKNASGNDFTVLTSSKNFCNLSNYKLNFSFSTFLWTMYHWYKLPWPTEAEVASMFGTTSFIPLDHFCCLPADSAVNISITSTHWTLACDPIRPLFSFCWQFYKAPAKLVASRSYWPLYSLPYYGNCMTEYNRDWANYTCPGLIESRLKLRCLEHSR